MKPIDAPKIRRGLSKDLKIPAAISTPTQAIAAEVLEVIPVVMNAIRMVMRKRVGDHLSVPQFRCLNYISREPGCSIGAIAGFLGVTLPTASAMVDRLVKAGSVVSETASEDRRRTELHPTKSGLAQLEQRRHYAQDELERVLSTCSAQGLKEIQAGLAVLWLTFGPNSEQS